MSRARPDETDGPGPLPTRLAIAVLLVVAVLEVVVNRVGLRALAPTDGQPPAAWYAWLDYLGLFLSYFAGILAVAILAARAVATLAARRRVPDGRGSPAAGSAAEGRRGEPDGRGLAAAGSAAEGRRGVPDGRGSPAAGSAAEGRRGVLDGLAQLAVLGAVGLFALEIVLDAPEWVAVPAEAMFGLAVVATVLAGFGRGRDLGAQIGLITLAMPLLVHTVGAFCVHFVWEDTLSEQARSLAAYGVMALALAALVSPYCFAPRPFARAVARPVPIVVAMALAAGGAIAAREAYPHLVPIVANAIGVAIAPDHPDSALAIYLLAVATLAWTLTSCALAPAASRRQIGAGLALLVLGGNAYRWPVHFLLPLVGLAIIAEATRHVRDEELDDMPIASLTPPIPDATWGAYIIAVATAMERTFGGIHTLTTRGEGGLVSTVIVAEQGGLPVRVRIERFDGAVLALDVVIGREIDEVRGATFTLWAIPPRALGINPAGPPAAPPCKTGDAELDTRFKLRGSAAAFHALFDAPLRTRAAALLAGWLAYWERDGLRYRVYPGRGSPLDLPLPLSDLAMGRSATPERLAALVELLAETGARGIVPSAAAPAELLDPDPDVEAS